METSASVTAAVASWLPDRHWRLTKEHLTCAHQHSVWTCRKKDIDLFDENKVIPYIGDISREDAIVLSEIAKTSSHILEFGVGASTQVLRAYSIGSMIAVDTSCEWIERTRSNLALLEIRSEVDFRAFDDAPSEGKWDLVFVDGADELRLPFAISAWSALVPGGRLMFHDTRRHRDFLYVTHLVSMYPTEVESAKINCMKSNISIITKRSQSLCDVSICAGIQDVVELAHIAGTVPSLAVHSTSEHVCRFQEARQRVELSVEGMRSTPDEPVRVNKGSGPFDRTHPDADGLHDVYVSDCYDRCTPSARLKTWEKLRDGDDLLMREVGGVRNVIEIALCVWLEVGCIYPNFCGSGYSLIRKKAAEPYVNWNDAEKRSAWEIGHGEPDIDSIRARLEGIAER